MYYPVDDVVCGQSSISLEPFSRVLVFWWSHHSFALYVLSLTTLGTDRLITSLAYVPHNV